MENSMGGIIDEGRLYMEIVFREESIGEQRTKVQINILSLNPMT